MLDYQQIFPSGQFSHALKNPISKHKYYLETDYNHIYIMQQMVSFSWAIKIHDDSQKKKDKNYNERHDIAFTTIVESIAI